MPKGNISEIITYLQKRNFILSKFPDKYILALLGKVQSGWIDIGKERLSHGDFLYSLTHSKAPTQMITFIPGETTSVALREISKELGISYVKLLAHYNLLAPLKDGIIMPESYKLPKGMGEEHLIRYLLDISNDTYKKMSKKIFRSYDPEKWHKYLTIASIIQKEAGNDKEMPLVSSVIYNRLKKGMKLQMDGTLNYGDNSHVKITPEMIKNDNSPFNTYKHLGLPPYPVCLVSMDALKAAIFPKKTNYLYFVRNKLDKNKGHKFFVTFDEHVREINRQKRIK